MQLELSTSNWLAAEHATIADLAMYSYIRVADEGGLDTSKYPAIEAWMVRVESLPGFVGMPRAADVN
jgi:glutathione S-transferase